MNQMQFTSIKKNNNSINVYSVENQNKQIQQAVPLVTRRNAFNIQPNTTTNVPIVTNNDIKEKKMKWGPPIWFLFHTIAEKIKADEFLSLKNEIIQNIVIICKNLPCPNCASHASNYISKVNFNAINTKEDLKMFLFNFHNSVNQKKGYPIFTKQELDEKYSKAVTINIFNNFLFHFQDKHKSIHMISDDMYRQRLSTSIKSWILFNINKFDQ